MKHNNFFDVNKIGGNHSGHSHDADSSTEMAALGILDRKYDTVKLFNG